MLKLAHPNNAVMSGIKRPIRSWREKGLFGIRAYTHKVDPAFDIDGLPNPFGVFFPVLVHNGHTAIIYVGAVLVSPPAGWTDSEQYLDSVDVGANKYTEKSNTTRSTPTAGTNETITLRMKYYADAGHTTLLGYDDFAITIYWESHAAGVIDDTDDFEVDLEGWTRVVEAGDIGLARSTSYSISGVAAMQQMNSAGAYQNVGYATKSVTIGSGSRAYIFGYFRPWLGISAIQIITPVETVLLPYPTAPDTWRRFGARLTPGVSNEVRLRIRGTGVNSAIFYDLIRWIRYA